MSRRNIYIAAPEGATGKSAIALGLLDALILRVPRVGVFRPLTASEDADRVVTLLLSQPGVEQPYDDAIGVTYAQMHDDPEVAHAQIMQRYVALHDHTDAMIVLGSDFTDVTSPNELSFNASVAANLGAAVVLVVHGHHRSPEQVCIAAEQGLHELVAHHAQPIAVVANRVEQGEHGAVVKALRAGLPSEILVYAIPEDPLISAPTVADLMIACDGRLVRGREEYLQHESLGLVVAAMSLPNVLDRLRSFCTVIAPGDRHDLLPGLILANESVNFPNLASIVLTGGYLPPTSIQRLIAGVDHNLPIVSTDLDTFETARRLDATRGRVTADSQRKIAAARRLFEQYVDAEAIVEGLDVAKSSVVTPLMFEFELIGTAKANPQHIVLPEGNDNRVLRAAETALLRGVAELTILGEPAAVRAQAESIGVDLHSAHIVSPHDPVLIERFAQEYARLRAHKGMTLDQARIIVTDVSYFGTMMVQLGLADGMVSGAVHTTAQTIKPAFEIVKTLPGVDIVSSVFLMCLADRVLVYGDCAINPDPTAEQLADIAISSADTATQFGIEPRVAMLSYSTGSSGAGEDVDKVRRATALVRVRRPDLLLEGPIQYDAAVDSEVAEAKLPGSLVAGRATVFIFPDLNTGNNTYKAVQRSAGAVAIGPVLQGLNKPVNDLSRGALVNDIFNTIAITAVQAQGIAAAKASDQSGTP